jgi:hypothetical protein
MASEPDLDHPLFTTSIPGNFDTNSAFLALVHLSSSEEEPELIAKKGLVRRTIKKKQKKNPYEKKVKETEFVMKNLGI